MTKQMPAQIAAAVLNILVKEIGLRAGQCVPDQLLKTKFRERGGNSEDIADGLAYAYNQDWLSYDSSKDAFYLTEVGFAAA